MMLSESYPEQVRVIQVPDVSIELCGGTHVPNTRDCFPFRIIASSALLELQSAGADCHLQAA